MNRLRRRPGLFAAMVGGKGYSLQDYINRIMALSPDIYWPMQEESDRTVVDYIGNNSNGTFGADYGISPNDPGLYGKSYKYTGIVNAPIYASAALTAAFTVNEFTISMWFKLTPEYVDGIKISECWNDTLATYYAIEIRSNKVWTQVRATDGTQALTGSIVLTDNIWHHLAFFHSVATDTFGCYIDGVLEEVEKTYGSIATPYYAGHPYFMELLNGNLQHIAIFLNKKLSQTEVNTICT